MSDTFANGFAQESKARVRPDHSPQRRAKAAKSFQRLERGLTNEQKVAIMDLFETNTAAADMFSWDLSCSCILECCKVVCTAAHDYSMPFVDPTSHLSASNEIYISRHVQKK